MARDSITWVAVGAVTAPTSLGVGWECQTQSGLQFDQALGTGGIGTKCCDDLVGFADIAIANDFDLRITGLKAFQSFFFGHDEEGFVIFLSIGGGIGGSWLGIVTGGIAAIARDF